MAIFKDFVAPSFLQGQSTDEIHNNMFSNLPNGMDKAEGGFPWDMTRPAAAEKSRLIQQNLTLAIQSLVPMWSYDTMLDYHAQNRGTLRKAAEFSHVTITVVGISGTEIAAGTKFSTEAATTMAAIEFGTDADAIIPVAGTIDINATAAVAGAQGNVTANSIVLQSAPISGITSVTNAADAAGGYDEESDESLRLRLVEFDQTSDVSFVGSPSDYKRWAEEVAGVGQARIILPAVYGDKLSIVISDLNGAPATEELCTAVYNHIMRPDNPMLRLAPVNGEPIVTPPLSLDINISALVQLIAGVTIDAAKAAFVALLQKYLLTATDMVRYNQVTGLLIETGLVEDYTTFTVNGGTANVALDSGQIAVSDASKVVFTVV